RGAALGVEKFREFLDAAADDAIPPLVPYRVCDAIKEAGYDTVEDDVCMIMVRKNYFSGKDGKHLLLATLPDMMHADLLGMGCERMVMMNTADPRLAVEVELLVGEFLNNVIMHGIERRQQQGPKILVDLLIGKQEVFITVWDKGKPWVFNNAPVTIDENIWDENNKLATAGRGMAIMKSIASSIESHRYGDLNETSFTIERKKCS
ncbi:MAG: ATP-binding protein, partial [Victivallales bacterium]|nr:ATP-binding protein [Victivallales bacterium]